MKTTSIDQIFAEAQAIGRPRSTYIYSIVFSFVNKSGPMKEVTSISTNKVDNKCLIYNNMKMANHLGITVLQFVADGDSRFRNQMMCMAMFVPKESKSIHIQHIQANPTKPFFAEDSDQSINHYLLLKCTTDVFYAAAPIIGGLPRKATLLKSTLLSCKPSCFWQLCCSSQLCR